MKAGKTSYIALGGIAAIVLALIVAVGFAQRGAPERNQPRIAMGKPLSEQQVLARRRGAIGTVAVVGTTAP
ncbi:hypothetical protein GGQ80_003538 [Sphingomonas jinjuensis]|uniref:Uncharacterized protein n=1 Tax=Sphingomonas jinjuensis TaxID=535907 RepID=A0A840F8R8_9SPHN|nr:hypothetical protein [Sphingomonas jinjuensis]MBB4155613.1 hypothetical protein [Sphingomonas jinjuensis]